MNAPCHTGMLSYDAPQIRTDTFNSSHLDVMGRQRFLGASSLNAPTSRPAVISVGTDAGSVMLIDVLGSHLGLFSVSPVSRLGSSSCQRTLWLSASTLQCWYLCVCVCARAYVCA